MTAPENRRITVKFDASIDLFSNASRHKIEFPAKATSAKQVVSRVFAKELFCIG
jgi:hypothetical protein